MANLVAPVNLLQPIENRIIEFKGLNRKSIVDEGEMSDMLNMSPDNYPTLTPRKLRGTYTMPVGAVEALQILERFERIAMIAKKQDGSIAFFYHLTEVSSVIGLTADTRMVAINTKICFFPQKTYIELVRTGSVVTVGSFGYLEANETATSASIALSNEDAVITMNSTQSASRFSYDDAISMAGTISYTDKDGTAHSDVALNVSCIVEKVDAPRLYLPRDTFIELTGEGATNIIYNGTVTRTMPDMDQIVEWNNRLWGASNVTNTIYACKLGDPKNWQYYQATGLDSFYAEQGTDEDWTGVAAYSGHLVFFKQNSMTKVYGTAPANFQIANAVCYGVEQGSRDSVAIINDTVFYKSTIGIMAYDGSTPYCISDKLDTKFRNVIAGTEGRKYYASCQVGSGYELFVLDVNRAMWHKEDNTRFVGCATMDGSLYYIDNADKQVKVINPDVPTETYPTLNWMAAFGPFTEFMENKKIYSRLLLRFRSRAAENESSSVSVYIALDEGDWELVKTYSNVSTSGEYIPIIPRRCDRYSIKLVGTGNVEIQSLTRKVRLGTGNKL